MELIKVRKVMLHVLNWILVFIWKVYTFITVDVFVGNVVGDVVSDVINLSIVNLVNIVVGLIIDVIVWYFIVYMFCWILEEGELIRSNFFLGYDKILVGKFQ